MRTGQACGIGQQDQGIPGCGSGPLQRWGFALRELRQALRDRKERPGYPTGSSDSRDAAAAEGIDREGKEPF